MAVEAVEEKIPDEKAVFLVEGKLVAWKLFAAPQHTSVELAVDVGAAAAAAAVAVVVHNWDIEVLAEEFLEEVLALALVVPAYGLEDHVDAAAYQVVVDCI